MVNQRQREKMDLHEGKLKRLMETANQVVMEHAGTRVNGKVASFRTQEYSRQFMQETCRRLHDLGYYLTDIKGLSEKHIEALCQSWYSEGKSNKTMQNQFSRLKIFCGWMGKSNIVFRRGVGVHPYLVGVAGYEDITEADLKVSTVTQKSKSWSGNGNDVVKEIKRATEEDPRFGAMMLMGLGFGLRKKEQLKIKPWRAHKGNFLEIDDNIAKGGRRRTIEIEEGEYGDFQRWCLDKAKDECRKYDTLGWPELTYKACENRYYHYARKLGFTKEMMGVCMHGLRAEFAENMALIRGLMPPSLGGSTSQMTALARTEITDLVSDKLGHEKEHTIGAYYGSFRKSQRTDDIGSRIGTVIIDSDSDLIGILHVNPSVVQNKDKKYRKKSKIEREQTVVTIQVERSGVSELQIGIADFMDKHTQLSNKVLNLLTLVGLGPDHES